MLEKGSLRKKLFRIAMFAILLTTLVSAISIDLAMAYAVAWPYKPPQQLFRGGTFGVYFWIQTYREQRELSYSYWLETPFDPLIVSWDPSPPVTLPPGGEHQFFFNLTIPSDAPLGSHRIWFFVSAPGDVTGIYWDADISALSTSIDFDPAYIGVGNGEWIYCHIEPPEPNTIWLGWNRNGRWFKDISYSPNDINVSTLRLNNTVSAEPSFAEVSDYDGDGIFDLKVAFNRTDVEDFIFGQGITEGNVTLEVTGQFLDGWAFVGSNQVEIIVNSTVDIIPNTLNLRSKAKFVTAFIELPEGYDVNDIDVNSILLNDTCQVDVESPMTVGDHDNDGIPDFMMKFNGTEVISYIIDNINMTKLAEEGFMTITLTITGKLYDETLFRGSDTIRILTIPRGPGRSIFPN